jgi:hypothetical protein
MVRLSASMLSDNSAAHFSSVFRREFGLSPRDYRGCDLAELEALRLAGVESGLIEAILLLSRGSSFSEPTPAKS